MTSELALIAIEAAASIMVAYRKAGLVSQEQLDMAIKSAEERQDDVARRIRESD